MSIFSGHPAAQALQALGALGNKPPVAKTPVAEAVVLDSVPTDEQRAQMLLDDAGTFSDQALRLDVAAAVQEWAETTPADLDEGETMADRLVALLVGIADQNQDGDLDPDEENLVASALQGAADYMSAKGVSDDDVSALLNDGDDAAAGRVAELLKNALPDGEDASMDDVDSFAFDTDAETSLFDSVTLDAVYKKKVVVRGGMKVRVNKRVTGRVVLSAGQKLAIRKAQRKAHSAQARIRRAKSMKIRQRSGLAK